MVYEKNSAWLQGFFSAVLWVAFGQNWKYLIQWMYPIHSFQFGRKGKLRWKFYLHCWVTKINTKLCCSLWHNFFFKFEGKKLYLIHEIETTAGSALFFKYSRHWTWSPWKTTIPRCVISGWDYSGVTKNSRKHNFCSGDSRAWTESSQNLCLRGHDPLSSPTGPSRCGLWCCSGPSVGSLSLPERHLNIFCLRWAVNMAPESRSSMSMGVEPESQAHFRHCLIHQWLISLWVQQHSTRLFYAFRWKLLFSCVNWITRSLRLVQSIWYCISWEVCVVKFVLLLSWLCL